VASLTDVTVDDPSVLDSIDTSRLNSSISSERKARHGSYYRGQTLNEIARFGGYAEYSPPGNVDRYVAEAMKSYNYELYDSLRGKTRRGAGLSGLYTSLLKFDGNRTRWSDLSSDTAAKLRESISRARTAFRLPEKSEPLEWFEVGEHLRTDTSAGITWPGKTKGEILEELYPAARWLGHRMKQGGGSRNPAKLHFPPAIAAKRGHLSDIAEAKTRLVWVYPAEMLVVEGLYAPKMYKAFQQWRESPLLFGSSPSRQATTFAASHPKVFKKLGMDFSAFDAKVPAFLVATAFDILKQNVEWDTWHGQPVTKSQKRKWSNVWANMVWYHIHTPILMPDGRMFRKHRGIPSGSWWTQLIDSVINWILVDFLVHEQDQRPLGLKVLGDDSACHVVDFNVPRAVLVAKETFGMTVNGEKSELSTEVQDFKLLGTRHRKGVPYRESEEWFQLLLYPEFPPRNLEISMSRFVGLWLSGAMYDSLFCDFWDYFQSGFPVPTSGRFTRDQRRGLTAQLGSDPGPGWSLNTRVFREPHWAH